MIATRPLGVALTAGLLAAVPARAQVVLERTPNLSGGWVGLPGMVEFDVLQRYFDPPVDGLGSLPTVLFALGLRPPALLGASFAVQSPVAPGQPDEAELFGRYAAFSQERGAPVDAAVQLGFNTAAQSVDGELALARWLGPLRLLAAARLFTNGYDTDEVRGALAGGAVVHPFPGRVPVALAADLGTLLDRDDGERWAWGAALQVGLSFISSTLSLQATNATSGTLEGASLGRDRTRVGFEVTVPIPTLAQLIGYYVSREVAERSVRPVAADGTAGRGGASRDAPEDRSDRAPRDTAAGRPPAAPRAVRVAIRDYLFRPGRIEVAAGSIVEWVNEDDVVHTATADDAAWNSGAIPPGGRWSATFETRGVYPYHCGPHPFMRGVVIVR